MPNFAIVTGSAGLIGAEAARFLYDEGFHLVGIDNDMRRNFFGDDTSTLWSRRQLHGQRTLSVLCGKDLQQEVVVPAATFTFHDEALFAGMLFQ